MDIYLQCDRYQFGIGINRAKGYNYLQFQKYRFIKRFLGYSATVIGLKIMLTYYLPIEKDHFSNDEYALEKYISEERRNSIRKFRFDHSRLLSLYSALLARFAVCRLTDMDNSILTFSKSDLGKPFLTGHDDVDFNISHTKGMIICSVSDSGKVGVDVEQVRPIKYDIMKRCFHPEEITYINTFTNPDLKGNPLEESTFLSTDNDLTEYNKHFFKIWTKKEAYTKFLGTGLATDITAINVLSKELSDNLFTFEENGFIFSVYSDCCNEISPVRLDIDEISGFFTSQ